MTKTAMLLTAASLVGGCAPDGPFGTVGAIVTAPITAPVMFVSARMSDREDHIERARRNHRPPDMASARASCVPVAGMGSICA